MNEKDKMKLKKIRLLVETEENNITQMANTLNEGIYCKSHLDENFEAYLDARLIDLEEVSIILSHKLEVLKRLSESFRSFE